MLDKFVGEKMKNVFALVALCLALSLSACTKKQEETAPPAGEQVEGTTSAPAENSAPAEEMHEKKEEAPAAH